MRQLNLHCISPQYYSLRDISFIQSKLSGGIKRIHLLGQYSKTYANVFSELKVVQIGPNNYNKSSNYLESIHIERNGKWFDVDFNKPMSLMTTCKNNYDDTPTDMKQLVDLSLEETYLYPDNW